LFWGEQQAVVALVAAACNFSRQEYFSDSLADALAIRLSRS